MNPSQAEQYAFDEKLARRINEYWTSRGYRSPNARTVVTSTTVEQKTLRIWAIKSDLGFFLPPKA